MPIYNEPEGKCGKLNLRHNYSKQIAEVIFII